MGKKLYVGNLSYDTTDSSLEEAFARVGSVVSANVITDRETGRSRGFGFVEMAEDSDADAAIQELDGKQLDGRTIKVNEAKPRPPRDDRGGFGGGDRGSSRGGGGGRSSRW